jgi:hypothetical protein
LEERVLQIDVLAGSARDPIGKEGLAWWTAHSLFPGDLKKEIFVGREHVQFRFPIPKAQEEVIIEEILDGFSNPMWYPRDIEAQKNRAMAVLTQRSSLDEHVREELFGDWIYSGHPYGHFELGTVDSSKEISVSDIQEFFSQQYVRSSTSLAWNGAADRRSILDRIQSGLNELSIHLPKSKTLVALSSPEDTQIMLFQALRSEEIHGVFGLVVPKAEMNTRLALLTVQELLCGTEEHNTLEQIFFIHDPMISCSFSASSKDEVFDILERLLLLYTEIPSLEEELLLKAQAKGYRKLKKDQIGLVSAQRLFLKEEVGISSIEDLRSSLQRVYFQSPKIMLVSPHGSEFVVEIEEFFSKSVFFVDRFPSYILNR